MRILYLVPGVGISDLEKMRREKILNEIARSGDNHGSTGRPGRPQLH